MNIEGCVALVTGANRGLGRAYAEALLAGRSGKGLCGRAQPVRHHRRTADADPPRHHFADGYRGGD